MIQFRSDSVFGRANGSFTGLASSVTKDVEYTVTATSTTPLPTYNWSVGTGGVIVSGQGTATVVVKFTIAGSSSLSMYVSAPMYVFSATTVANTTVVNPFAPSDIAGLYLWLDANSGVTLDVNGNVTTWANQYGAAGNVTQATTNKMPAYTASAVNGLYGITFDGVNDELTGAAPLLSGDNDFCMYAVVKKLAASGVSGTAYFSIGTDKSFGLSIGSTGGSTNKAGYLNGGVAWRLEAPDLANDSVVWQELRRVGAGTTDYLRSGGATLSFSNTPVAAPYGNYRVGSHSGAAGSFQNMIICELLFYTTIPSAGDRTTIQNYLATRWGI